MIPFCFSWDHIADLCDLCDLDKYTLAFTLRTMALLPTAIHEVSRDHSSATVRSVIDITTGWVGLSVCLSIYLYIYISNWAFCLACMGANGE